jgi:hypothetical protein
MNFFSNLQPHCALIAGKRGCGKSVLACQLLENEFRGYFDNIVIICPTFSINAAYRRPWLTDKKDKNVYVVSGKTFEKYDINTILLHFAKTFKCRGHTLFLIDDCAYSGDVRHKETALTQLAFISRHAGISIWVITQKYNAICKDFRDQLSWVALFRCNDKDSFKSATDQNNALSTEDKIKAEEFLRVNAHSKLIIRNDDPVGFMLKY